MEFIKKYLKTPISAANEKGEQASVRFGIIALVVFFAYTLICKIVSAWEVATYSFYSKLDFGDKIERYFDYLFDGDGLITIFKSSLISLILFAVFVLFLFAVLKLFKKENANYLRISTTLLLTNLYVVPIGIVLGILGIFKAKFIVSIVTLLTTIYAIAFIVLNLFAIHKIFEEEDHDKAFRMLMLAIIALVVLLALISFLFADDLGSSINLLSSFSGISL